MCTSNPTVMCSVEFCQKCSGDSNICEECGDGFVEDDEGACVRGGGIVHVVTGK